MTTDDSSDIPQGGDLPLRLGALVDAVLPSTESVASLAEIFYDLFPDAEPRGNRDLGYFAALLRDFGKDLDVFEELKRYAAWTLDHGSGAARSPRSSLRDWLRRQRSYRRHYPSRL